MTAPLPIEGYRSPEPSLGPLEQKYGAAFRGRKAFWWMVRAVLFTLWALVAIVGHPFSPGAWVWCGVAFVHCLIVWDFRRNADIEVHVHRDGFRVHRKGVWKTVAWDDIRTYSTRVDRGARSFLAVTWWSNSVARTRVIVATCAGEEIELTTSLEGLLKVGARIRAESLERLRRSAKAAIEAGQSVTFGDFSVDREGPHRDGETLPWNELARVSVESGDIVVRRKGALRAWSRKPYPGTPNAHLFVDLLEDRLQATPVKR